MSGVLLNMARVEQVGKAAGQQAGSIGVDADACGMWRAIEFAFALEHGHMDMDTYFPMATGLQAKDSAGAGAEAEAEAGAGESQHYRLRAGGRMSGYGMAKFTPNTNWWLKWLPRCNNHVSICDMTRTTPRGAVAVGGGGS